jgi:hypothetical protein
VIWLLFPMSKDGEDHCIILAKCMAFGQNRKGLKLTWECYSCLR